MERKRSAIGFPLRRLGLGRDFFPGLEEVVGSLSRTMSVWECEPMSPCSLVETESEFLVALDVPGADPKAVDVQVFKDRLVVKTPRCGEEVPENARVHLAHRRPTADLDIEFPSAVDPDGAVARIERGVLRLKIPKAKNSGGRTVPCQAAEG
jgi:HSP20 family protein